MWRSALRYSAVGLEMGVAVLLGYALGAWLDGKWDTKPYLTLGGLLLGIVTGFRGLIRAAMEASRQDAGEDDDNDGNKSDGNQDSHEPSGK